MSIGVCLPTRRPWRLSPAKLFTSYLTISAAGSGAFTAKQVKRRWNEATTVGNILDGLYERPVQVIAFNASAGWARDVTADIARAVLKRAQMEHRLMGGIARGFVIRTLGPGAIA
jgi:hypothetical protein